MIFIEVGAHLGESYEVAKHPKYGFQQFWLIEPARKDFEYLSSFKDNQIYVLNVGLGGNNCEKILYKPGTKGASIFIEKYQNNNFVESEKIIIRKASEVLGPILNREICFIKLNCEGSEVLILEDLLQQKLLNQTHSLLIDFDMLKINKNFDLTKILENLILSGVRFYDAKDIGMDCTELNVKKWLEIELEKKHKPYSVKDYFKYKLFSHLPLRKRYRRIVMSFVPILYRRKIYKKYKIIKNYLSRS
jgi:FkbM family methyltransferase